MEKNLTLEELLERIDEIQDEISRLESDLDLLRYEVEAMDSAAAKTPASEPQAEPFSQISYPHFDGCKCGKCPTWRAA